MSEITVAPSAPVAPQLTRAQRMEAMLKEEETKTAPPAPPAPKPPESVETAEVKPPEPVKAAPPPAKETEKVPADVPDPIKRSFEKLAEREAKFRKEQDAVKPHLEMLRVFSPAEAAALARAKASGDPLAVLTASGFSYADVANRMVDLSVKKPGVKVSAPEPEEPQEHPEVKVLKSELAEMKAWRAEQQRLQVLSQVRDLVKDRPDVVALAKATKTDAGSLVLDHIMDFFNRTGKLPGENLEESVAVAAEAVEQRAKDLRAAFGPPVSKDLTPTAKPATVDAGTREAPVGEEAPEQVTITNDATTAPRADGLRKSREERFKEILADPKFWPAE